ncbi:hypothetical protein ACFWDA_25260 [Rhodococcus zopfii]|uniref:hypothetical protein n=1 Tax=Rhodococcus zopfii TaxID=43772 RepID=UPI0036665F12
MSIFRKRRTAPRRRIFESVTAAPPTRDQDEQRQRRRTHRIVVYTGTFDLTAEVEAVLSPLAARPEIARYPQVVSELTVAVHEAVLDLGRLLAERDARRRTADLADDTRGRATDLIVAARPRPACPTIDRDALVSGSWSSDLVEHAAPLTEPLRAYLAAALPPGATGRAASVSERVVDALRPLDRAAADAARRLDRLEATRAASVPDLPDDLRRLNATQTELDALGIVVGGAR